MTSRIQPKSGVYSVSKADFTKVFEDVPKVAVTSAVDLRNKFETIRTVLSNSSEDWNKRQTQLKTIRSIVIHGEPFVDRSQMVAHLLQLLGCFETAVKDLRSQILREAAITCSFIVSKFGIEVHSIGEDILAPAMAQVAVSTKIMASSASTLTEFIVEYIQTRQVFTILSSFSTSKDKTQRRQLATLLEIVIRKWPDRIKKQIIRQICELIKSAINDADSETRTAGRKAFAKLDEMHPEDAEVLFQELEPVKQKMLRGGDAASSWASVNSDKGSIPVRSKLSTGSKAHANISAKFLAQRSASAIDPATKISASSRLVRPTSTKTVARQDTSPAGTKIPHATRPGSRTRTSSITSQSDSRDTSPTRKHSPLPFDLQKARVHYGNGSFFAKLGMPDETDDDEFLLPIRIRSPQKTAPGEMRDAVSSVLKACCSSSAVEKKEGVKKLLPIVADNSLNPVEIKNIGNCLNRLLSDASNTMVLEIYSIFVRTHASRLSDWLRLALAKLFAKKASETLPNTKKQIAHILNVILESFNAHHQLVTVCELMCDPIHLMVPKARVVLLEYMTSLLDEYTEPGASINVKELNSAMRKMFAWIGDQRQAMLLTPHVEKVICSMFCVNVADFSVLISEFDIDQKNWIHQTLQRNGLENGTTSGHSPRQAASSFKNESSSSSLILPELGGSARKGINPASGVNLGSFNATNAALSRLEEQSTSRLMEKVNLDSTVTLPQDTFEKIQSVQELLQKMRCTENAEEQEMAISSIYMMICDGGFGVWEQCYAKLLLNLFEILSTSQSENNKKMCLRILAKMCTAQAAKLFDSTEMAVCKVLDAAVNTNDATTSLAVDDCLRTLATHLPLAKIINIAKVILNQEPIDNERASLVLKMVTKLFEELQSDELQNVVDDITPCIIKTYQSTSSSVRKTVVYCLVAMVNRVGEPRMAKHFTKLPKAMTNLIQVYVNRAISTSLPRL